MRRSMMMAQTLSIRGIRHRGPRSVRGGDTGWALRVTGPPGSQGSRRAGLHTGQPGSGGQGSAQISQGRAGRAPHRSARVGGERGSAKFSQGSADLGSSHKEAAVNKETGRASAASDLCNRTGAETSLPASPPSLQLQLTAPVRGQCLHPCAA